jgi:hypothetical protein
MIHARDDYNRIQDPANKIPLLEPVFLLRAQDKLAADCVEYWAEINEKNGGDPALTGAAREHAHKMRKWPVRKMPDAPQNQGMRDE